MFKGFSLTHSASIVLTLSLAACGGGGGGGDTPPPPPGETIMPTAQISFPPAKSLTQANQITVYGSASDNVGVTSLTVNGVAATTTDEFANWTATVTLTQGSNTLTVSASDAAGNANTTAAQVTIDYQPRLLYKPRAAALDSANNRLLLIDRGTLSAIDGVNGEALVAMDLSTGVQTTLSDNAMPNDENAFVSPHALCLDSTNNRVLVLDRGLSGIIAVDLATGARTILSSNTIPNADNPFEGVDDIVFDTNNSRLLVLMNSSILAVDLTSGVRTVVSAEGIPDTTNEFLYAQKMVMDEANNRALIVARIPSRAIASLIAVDLATGARSVVSDTSMPNANNSFSFAQGVALALDSANNRALIGEPYTDAMFAVDLTTGARSVVLDTSMPGVAGNFKYPRDIVMDTANNRALIIDSNLPGVYAMDLTTSALTQLTSFATQTPGDTGTVSGYESIEFDSANDQAVAIPYSGGISTINTSTGETQLVAEAASLNYGSFYKNLAFDGTNNRLILTRGFWMEAMDLDSGQLTEVSSPDIPSAVNLFRYPQATVVDSDNNRAFVVDNNTNAIFEINLANGSRTIIADKTTPNTHNVLDAPLDMAFDQSANRLLVLDRTQGTLIAVSLADSTSTLISNDTTPDSVNALEQPRAMVLDSNNNRVLVLDDTLDAVVAIDLSNGARTILSSSSVPNADNALDGPTDITLDSANNRALVVDARLEALLGVDLTTGARTVISNPAISGSLVLTGAGGVEFDANNNRALVESYSWGMLAIDLDTGAGSRIEQSPSSLSLRALADADIDTANNRVIALNDSSGSVLSVALDTGVHSIISDNDTQLPEHQFARPQAIALDAANGRALVTDQRANAVFDVDLATGTRSILSSRTIPDDVNAFVSPSSIVIDSANNRALVRAAANDETSIVAIDLTTGARTILSSSSIPDTANPLNGMRAMIADLNNNRLLGLISSEKGASVSILAIDLTTGARTVFADNLSSAGTNPLTDPEDMMIDTQRNLLLVVGRRAPEVIAIHLSDGQRVILSR